MELTIDGGGYTVRIVMAEPKQRSTLTEDKRSAVEGAKVVVVERKNRSASRRSNQARLSPSQLKLDL